MQRRADADAGGLWGTSVLACFVGVSMGGLDAVEFADGSHDEVLVDAGLMGEAPMHDEKVAREGRDRGTSDARDARLVCARVDVGGARAAIEIAIGHCFPAPI